MDHRDFDDDEKPKAKDGMFFDFECPECSAHNPHSDGFKDGSEILCFYCGVSFRVKASEGRFKLKPV